MRNSVFKVAAAVNSKNLFCLFMLFMSVIALFMFTGCPKPATRRTAPTVADVGVDAQRLIDELKQRASKLGPGEECERAGIMRKVGLLELVYNGDSNAAIAAMEKVLTTAAGDPWANFVKGLTAETRGFRRDALAHYMKVLEGEEGAGSCLPEGPLPGVLCEISAAAAKRAYKLFEEDVSIKDFLSMAQKAHETGKCPESRRILGDILRRSALLRGDPGEVRRLADGGGCIAEWSVSRRFGGFSNIELDGRLFAPAQGGWKNLSVDNCDITLNSEDGMQGLKEIRSGFKLRSGSSALVWVNGGGRDFTLSLSGMTLKRSAGRDEWPSLWSVYPVELDSGYHEAVLRFPVDLGGYRVQIRLTDLQGRPLDLNYSVKAKPGKTTASVKPASMEDDEYAAVLDFGEPASEAYRPWYDFLKIERALRHGLPKIGKKHVDLLVKRAPGFGAGRLIAAETELRWPFAGFSSARDRAVHHLARVLQSDPEAVKSIAKRLKIAWEADRYESALALADRGAGMKDSAVWDIYRARVLQDRGWLVLADQASLAAVRKEPRSRLAWETRLSLGRQRNDFKAIETAARVLRDLDRSSDVWARLLLNMGREEEALKEYRRLLTLTPGGRDAREGAAVVLSRLGRLEEAESIYREMIEEEGWNPDLRLALAEVLLERGIEDKAREVLIKGRDLRPQSAELRRALGGLGVDNPVEPYRVDGADYMRRYGKDIKTEGEKSAVIVLDRAVIKVLPSGGLVQLTHQIVHMRSGADLRTWGHVNIPDEVEALTVRTVKPDGTVREPEPPSGFEPIHLPNLEVGDYVEVETMVTRPPLAALQGGFMAGRFYFAGHQGDAKFSEFVLVTPREMDLLLDLRGDAPRVVVERKGEVVVRRWSAENLPRFEQDPHSPPPVDCVPSVRAASGVTWEILAGMIDAGQSELDLPSHEMRVLAEKLCRGKTDPEKVRRVYDWVNKNIEQSGAFQDTAKETLARRRGYRLVLARALLRLCSVDVSTIMVEPVHRAEEPGAVPDLSSFSYPVLRAETGPGEFELLFPFMESIPLGFIPAMLRGARAIRVTDGPYEFLTAPEEAGRDGQIVDMDVTVQPDGGATVKVVETMHGWPAVIWRRDLKQMSRTMLMQSFQQGRLAPNFPGAEMDRELIVENLDDNAKPLVLRYSFKAADFMRPVSERLVLRRSFFPQMLASTYLTRTERKAPLLFGAHPDFELKMSLKVPAGFRTEMVSPADKVKAPYGSVERKVEKDKDGTGKIHINVNRRLGFFRVEVDSYGDFGEFARRADGIEELVIVLSENGDSQKKRK